MSTDQTPDRGRKARTPAQIPMPGWKDIARRVGRSIGTEHIGLIAAGVAFYALLGLFPAIAASVAIAGLLTEPEMLVNQIERIGTMMPQQATEIVLGQAQAVAGSEQGGLTLAALGGVALALYSASRGMASLIEGLNVAFGEREDRSFVVLLAFNVGLTVFLILGLLVAASVSVVLPAVLSIAGLGGNTQLLIGAASWAALLVLGILGLAVIYRFGPSRRPPRWRWVTPGALLAVLLWLAGSAGFAFYVSNFASYNETFGALAGVVILLMWLWLSAYIVLLGAVIDAEIEAQTRIDTTTGRRRPPGRRGTSSADRVGEVQHG